MGTDETCMGWISDEIGATGFGLAECAEVAASFCNLHLQGATLAVEGFGNVGRHVAHFLEEKGVILVAASDSQGTIYDLARIPVVELTKIKKELGTVLGYSKGKKLKPADFFGLPCDILITAARPDSIYRDNANGIPAKLILQGANIPATPEIEKLLHQRTVQIVPDFMANAGEVICAAVEYRGGTETLALNEISQKIGRNTEEVFKRSH